MYKISRLHMINSYLKNKEQKFKNNKLKTVYQMKN